MSFVGTLGRPCRSHESVSRAAAVSPSIYIQPLTVYQSRFSLQQPTRACPQRNVSSGTPQCTQRELATQRRQHPAPAANIWPHLVAKNH
eukprot:scaffold40997_cov72-Phaeocystis_antarctica.AAC.3